MHIHAETLFNLKCKCSSILAGKLSTESTRKSSGKQQNNKLKFDKVPTLTPFAN
jgi:hypothetical protein